MTHESLVLKGAKCNSRLRHGWHCRAYLPRLWDRSNWLWVKTNGIPFWDRCTTHFRTCILVGIGMFTGGTIWVLTHGHLRLVWSKKGVLTARKTSLIWFLRESLGSFQTKRNWVSRFGIFWVHCQATKQVIPEHQQEKKLGV